MEITKRQVFQFFGVTLIFLGIALGLPLHLVLNIIEVEHSGYGLFLLLALVCLSLFMTQPLYSLIITRWVLKWEEGESND